MFSLSARRVPGKIVSGRALSSSQLYRFKSTAESSEEDAASHSYSFDKNGESTAEVVSFPSSNMKAGAGTKQSDSKPILLNAKEHAVGYLGRILNARVYEAAIETELQEAKNLSSVRLQHKCIFHV